MRKFGTSFVFALLLVVFGSLPAFGQQYCQDAYGNVFPCPPPPQQPFGQPWPYAFPGNSPLANQLNNTNAFVQGVTDQALIAPLAILGNQLGNAIRGAQPQYYPQQVQQYPAYPQQQYYAPPPGSYYPQGQYGPQQPYYQQQAPQYPQGPYYYPQYPQYPPYQQQQYGPPQGQAPYVQQPGGLQPQQQAPQPYGYYPWQQQRPPQRYRRTSQNEHIDLRDFADGAGNIVYASTGNPRAASAVTGAGQIAGEIKQILDRRQDRKIERQEQAEYERQVAAQQAAAEQQAQALTQLAQIESQKLALAQQQLAQNRQPQGPPQYQPAPQQQFAPQQQQKLRAQFKNCLLKGAILVHVVTDAGEENEFVIISNDYFQKLCHLPNRAGVQIINEGHLNCFRNWDHLGPISSIKAVLCTFDGDPKAKALNPNGNVVFSNMAIAKDSAGQPVEVPFTQFQQGEITVYSFCRPTNE